MPNIRWLLALITTVHRAIYRASDGWIGGHALGIRFLLLGHRGRRSGRWYETPLLYVEDEGRFAVAGSNAGDERDPQWWLNLQRHPEAELRIGRRWIPVKARKASAAECARLWPKLTASYRFYPRYQARVRREIPVVIFEPHEGAPSAGR
jgi:deazaflavin-dependent oxidoreductase (nitroreductase family)